VIYQKPWYGYSSKYYRRKNWGKKLKRKGSMNTDTKWELFTHRPIKNQFDTKPHIPNKTHKVTEDLDAETGNIHT
jgi:hypothetical protein